MDFWEKTCKTQFFFVSLQLENWDHGKHKKNTMKNQPITNL